ncbi:MAG: class I SAM-dependent methyltransferase [Actinobacteria bacterium]|nr:MAG: class I SAM-dependent methyltransferase [Actinomycetota bacterium]
MNYKIAYALGFHPWEVAEKQPSFNERFMQLLEREERGRQPPYGRALDIGTGSGIWGIKLAERGWQVVAIDIVEKALGRARERIQHSGVEMRLLQADVTALRPDDVGSDFKLILDTGTFHGLTNAQREAMGRGVSAIADSDATVLMLAWSPKRRGPLPRGADQGAIEAAFPRWTVTEVGTTGFQAPKPVELLMRPNERWYRLRRD